jgi:acetyl esterase/lipase
MRLLFLLSLLLMHPAAAAPERIPLWPAGAPEAKGQTDNDQPRLELYRPDKARANGAAVVVCPGGGYGGLAADHEGIQPARYFNSIGVTAYVLFYRLGSHGYRHPVPLLDAQRALRLVRSRAAQDGIDAERIGIMGFSAGGHLAATAGTQSDAGNTAAPDPVDRLSSRPAFMVLCYPVASFDPAITHKGSVNNLLGERAGDAALLRQLSSENNVTAQTPPAFLFHTTADAAVPVENSLRLYEALKRAGVRTELHAYQNGPHGVGLMHGDPVLGTWPGHLTAWLRGNVFLAGKITRTAVSGTVTINGRPVTWATLCFTPRDPAQPIVTAKARNGKYALDAKNGPPAGEVDITVTLSAADLPDIASADGFLTTTEKVHGQPEKLTTTLGTEKNSLDLALTWEK